MMGLFAGRGKYTLSLPREPPDVVGWDAVSF